MEKLWEEERQAWSSQGGSNPSPRSWPWDPGQPSPLRVAPKARQVPLSHGPSRQEGILQLACPRPWGDAGGKVCSGLSPPGQDEGTFREFLVGG